MTRPLSAPHRLALAALIACGLFSPVAAQETPEEPPQEPPQEAPDWRASAGVSYHTFASAVPAWEPWLFVSADVQRRFGWGAASVEGFRSRRFGLTDHGAGGDLYVETWNRAYVHLGARVVPDARTLPSSDLRAELYQGLDGGWEVSAGARRMAVRSSETIHVYGGSVAKYLPGWYVRGRVDAVPSSGDVAMFYSGTARRFVESLDGLIELTAGTGEEVMEVAEGPVLDVRRSRVGMLRVELFPVPRYGIMAAAGLAVLDGLPDRRHADLRLIVRW